LRASSSALSTCHRRRDPSLIARWVPSSTASGSACTAAAVDAVYCCGCRLPSWRASRRGRSATRRRLPRPGEVTSTNRAADAEGSQTQHVATRPHLMMLSGLPRVVVTQTEARAIGHGAQLACGDAVKRDTPRASSVSTWEPSGFADDRQTN
jgi:hypothetical protein